jgi:hypothetical protein
MKKYISIVFLFLFICSMGGLLFYWYQIRPAQIRHGCPWVKHHSDAVPARQAMTKEELESKGIIRTCNNEFAKVKEMMPEYDISSGDEVIFNKNFSFEQKRIIWYATSCREDGDRVIAEYKTPRKAIPAKDWYEKADEDEYRFCLHDKGL